MVVTLPNSRQKVSHALHGSRERARLRRLRVRDSLRTLAVCAAERRRARERSRLFSVSVRRAEATFVLTRRAADLVRRDILFGKAEIDRLQQRIARRSDGLGAPRARCAREQLTNLGQVNDGGAANQVSRDDIIGEREGR
jgi:hypothetical protein